MGGNKASIRLSKEGLRGIPPTAASCVGFLTQLKAFRVVRLRNELDARDLELLMAIDGLCEANEVRVGEYITCRAEIAMLLAGGLMDAKTFGHSRAVLVDRGLMTFAPSDRWTYNAMTYTVTRSGIEIIKQFKEALTELQIEMNKGKKVR